MEKRFSNFSSPAAPSLTVITWTDVEDVDHTTFYRVLTVPIRTLTHTITYPYLHTTFTETETVIENVQTRTHNNALRCAFDSRACPAYTTTLLPAESALKVANEAACFTANNYTQRAGFAGAPSVCCGECQLHFLKVDVFYFPPKGANGSACINTSKGPSLTTVASLNARDHGHPQLQARMQSLDGGSSTVLNGHTLLVDPGSNLASLYTLLTSLPAFHRQYTWASLPPTQTTPAASWARPTPTSP